jgi:hypothetical protein
MSTMKKKDQDGYPDAQQSDSKTFQTNNHQTRNVIGRQNFRVNVSNNNP